MLCYYSPQAKSETSVYRVSPVRKLQLLRFPLYKPAELSCHLLWSPGKILESDVALVHVSMCNRPALNSHYATTTASAGQACLPKVQYLKKNATPSLQQSKSSCDNLFSKLLLSIQCSTFIFHSIRCLIAFAPSSWWQIAVLNLAFFKVHTSRLVLSLEITSKGHSQALLNGDWAVVTSKQIVQMTTIDSS